MPAFLTKFAVSKMIEATFGRVGSRYLPCRISRHETFITGMPSSLTLLPAVFSMDDAACKTEGGEGRGGEGRGGPS